MNIDQKIALNVMGWLPPSHPKTHERRKATGLTHTSYDQHWLKPDGNLSTVYDFSYNIKHANDVVNKLTGCGCPFHVRRYQGSTLFYVSFIMNEGYSQSDEKLAMAICKAAMKATKYYDIPRGGLDDHKV